MYFDKGTGGAYYESGAVELARSRCIWRWKRSDVAGGVPYGEMTQTAEILVVTFIQPSMRDFKAPAVQIKVLETFCLRVKPSKMAGDTEILVIMSIQPSVDENLRPQSGSKLVDARVSGLSCPKHFCVGVKPPKMAGGTEILVVTSIQPSVDENLNQDPNSKMREFQAPAVEIKVPETFLVGASSILDRFPRVEARDVAKRIIPHNASPAAHGIYWNDHAIARPSCAVTQIGIAIAKIKFRSPNRELGSKPA
ncbi:hypothetical protein B0H13DRAFT_1871211 [Mycena leptocephala]|nr:hypothetical protein B0H13DRAFT_1871211 [Mycena leptocephala]